MSGTANPIRAQLMQGRGAASAIGSRCSPGEIVDTMIGAVQSGQISEHQYRTAIDSLVEAIPGLEAGAFPHYAECSQRFGQDEPAKAAKEYV